jgi:hypothetical protein
MTAASDHPGKDAFKIIYTIPGGDWTPPPF